MAPFLLLRPSLILCRSLFHPLSLSRSLFHTHTHTPLPTHTSGATFPFIVKILLSSIPSPFPPPPPPVLLRPLPFVLPTPTPALPPPPTPTLPPPSSLVAGTNAYHAYTDYMWLHTVPARSLEPTAPHEPTHVAASLVRSPRAAEPSVLFPPLPAKPPPVPVHTVFGARV